MLEDTIHAVASPPGASARGVLRVSGPAARQAVASLLVDPLPAARGVLQTVLQLPEQALPGPGIEALVLWMPGPGSYTGEDTVELHLPGAPLLLDLVASALAPHSRLATPGEFTRRAYQAGRLDLCAAEAVAGLIHAADAEQSRFALGVLRGGLSRAVGVLRGRLQDAWSLLEAGLDFDEEETGAVPAGLWRPGLEQAAQDCARLIRDLPETGVQGELLVWGPANAGKSALCNALVGEDRSLVSPQAGTTRDLLAFDLGGGLRLLDGPGDLCAPTGIDAASLAARERAAGAAAGLLVCQENLPGAAALVVPEAPPLLCRVWTKADLHPTPPEAADGTPAFLVSSRTGRGLGALREFLARQAGGGAEALVGRLQGELQRCARGVDAVLSAPDLPPELAALELQEAVAALDRIDGSSSPEDLLDRVFAGFCLGK